MDVDSSMCRCVVCRDYGDRAELDVFDLTTMRNVLEFGWSVVGIPTDGTVPGFAFTIGLRHSYRAPDLVMFGLPDVLAMQSCLNTVAQRVAAGEPVADGQVRHDVLAGYPVALRAVADGWHPTYLGAALGYYRQPAPEFLQVVWPDREGRFPWQDGDERFRDSQPQAWRAPGAGSRWVVSGLSSLPPVTPTPMG
jgi:hypothetical protein